MRIVIPGGSGQVGAALSRALWRRGHDVVVLSRRPLAAPWRSAVWDGESLGAWTREIEGAGAVINLAGRSVNCRYGPENRRRILDSRVRSTRIVGEAIGGAQDPPRVWLQAGTATIYAHRYDAANDERTGILGGAEGDAPDTWKFSIDVAMAWEQAISEARTPRTRRVIMRSAMTLGPARGGIFDALLALVRHGLGGRAGDGRQYISWIHEEDFHCAVTWLLQHDAFSGPVNVASPHPLPNAAFMGVLREAWGIRLGVPASRSMLELGAILLRTETELILKSRRVVPARLLESGFTFRFPVWPEAAEDLCRKWREARRLEKPAA